MQRNPSSLSFYLEYAKQKVTYGNSYSLFCSQHKFHLILACHVSLPQICNTILDFMNNFEQMIYE